MEATISRASSRHVELATGEWLRATRKLGRALLRSIGHALVHYSRPAMLLRGGERPFNRL